MNARRVPPSLSKDLPLSKERAPRPLARPPESRPPRSRTCLYGKLVYGDGMLVPEDAFTLDCAIRDLSESGAKITLAEHQSLPDDLYLIVVRHAVAYKAKVVWQKFPTRGLIFTKAYQLAEALPAEVAFLRRLWVELSGRSGHSR